MGQNQTRVQRIPPPPMVIPTNRVYSSIQPLPVSTVAPSRFTVQQQYVSNVIPGVIPSSSFARPSSPQVLVRSIVQPRIQVIPPPMPSFGSVMSAHNEQLRQSEVRLITPATQSITRVDPLRQSTVVIENSAVNPQVSFVRQTVQGADELPPEFRNNPPSSQVIVTSGSYGSFVDPQQVSIVNSRIPLPPVQGHYSFPTTGGIAIGGSGLPYHPPPSTRFIEGVNISKVGAPQFPPRNIYFPPTGLPFPRTIQNHPSNTQLNPIAYPPPSIVSQITPQTVQVEMAAELNGAAPAPYTGSGILTSQVQIRNSPPLQIPTEHPVQLPIINPPSKIHQIGLAQTNSTNINQLRSEVWNSKRVQITPLPPPQNSDTRPHTLIPIPISPPSEIKQNNSLLSNLQYVDDVADVQSSQLYNSQPRQRYELKMDRHLPSPPVYTFDYDLPLAV